MEPGFTLRASCPLCNAGDSRRLCEIPYSEARMAKFLAEFYHGRVPLGKLHPETYRVVACEQCGFIYQDKILDVGGMQALYQHWVDHAYSLSKKRKAGEGLYRQYAGQVQTLLRALRIRPDQVRLLEYGMGWGYWSRMAQAHGIEVTGFELSGERAEHARGMGLRVIDELPPPGAHYDCIYANQVFEHLPDPLPALQSLCERLAPGGLVYLRVPDGRGVARHLSRRGWSPLLEAIHPLEHINCFTRKTLIDLAARAGLRPLSPPPRLDCRSLVSGLKREFADRFLTTHVLFRRG